MKQCPHSRRLSALAALLCLLLSGCDRGSVPPQPAAPAPPIAAEPSTEQPSAVQHTLRVAAASDLRFALDEIKAKFEQAHSDCQVEVVYGSSGNLYAQIANKAPFDVFLSADISYPRQLIDAGLAAADSEFSYGRGRIVVWVPNASTLVLDDDNIAAALTAPETKKIAIANPRHAPYGRAAESALVALGVYDAVKDRLVLGENVAQAAQFVESGAADAGLIALSLALAPPMRDKGRFWPIPERFHPPLEQGGAVMAYTTNPAAARALCDFLQGDEAQEVLDGYGFVLPRE